VLSAACVRFMFGRIRVSLVLVIWWDKTSGRGVNGVIMLGSRRVVTAKVNYR